MTLTVEPVRGRRDLSRFIKLPFALHRDSPQWVPPLIYERRRFLDRRRNPYFEHAQAEFFLARRDGRVVGRITAQVDARWDEFQGGRGTGREAEDAPSVGGRGTGREAEDAPSVGGDGIFGFFECEDDPATASALVEAASGWLRERGRERMLGPMDFTTNDECGILVEGFDEPALILEPWHPPYYQRLLEGIGLTKTMDLLIWDIWLDRLKQGDRFHEFIEEAAKKAEGEHGVVVRQMRRRDLEAEVARFMDVYNEAWGSNWGFVPITEAEVAFQAKNLKPVLDENWAMIAELDGEVIGAALTLPDINQVLARMNGRLFPIGWLRYLTGRSKIDRVRIFALGIKPAYQHLGVAASLYVRQREMAARTQQKGGHAGWILETNEAMNRAMEGMGASVTKRYRIYERALNEAA